MTEPTDALNDPRTVNCTVLVVEDDDDGRRLVVDLLRRAQFRTVEASTGAAALRALFEFHPHLVVLDLGLPDIEGLTLLDRIRDVTDVPVLVLTGNSVESQRLDALLHGADDLVTKPFTRGDLLARSIRLIRRRPPAVGSAVLDDGTVRLDLVHRTATVDGELQQLTATDWRLLVAFVRAPGVLLTAERLLELAWHDPFGIGPERVKFAVLRLRRRVGWDGPEAPLTTVRGFGYRYQPRIAPVDR